MKDITHLKTLKEIHEGDSHMDSFWRPQPNMMNKTIKSTKTRKT